MHCWLMFFSWGLLAPKPLGVFRYRLLSYTSTWDCSSMLNLRFIPLGKGQKNKSFCLIVPHSSFVYLSVTQVITEPFAILVIPVPRKTNVFLKILLNFAAQKRKRSPILYLQPLTLSLYLMHETATMEESRKFKC